MESPVACVCSGVPGKASPHVLIAKFANIPTAVVTGGSDPSVAMYKVSRLLMELNTSSLALLERPASYAHREAGTLPQQRSSPSLDMAHACIGPVITSTT
eukprot:2361638-Rhodomonas_salina.1